ncbi:MAG TPA: site-2 protease family protein [Thermomicrobiales bacterium]|nr:site-2 protease family protein [Thermomicrobiales bacterium]
MGGRGGVPLGRIFGITIAVDWSWIVIFLLVLWNLAFGVLPGLHPGWGPGLTWGLAVVAALLFFASVLVHELAHSLVARAKGLPVRNITLFLFGGVSNIQREPPSPGAEFLITIVGPITSVVLGVIFTALGAAAGGDVGDAVAHPTAALAGLSPLATILLWLGPINILLGVFNLIPGFPLDGGRVLRSILWGLTDNLRRATRWAAGVGHVIAWLFIIAGVAMIFGVRLPFLGTGIISGLWLAFIGWFLNSAASQSYQQVVVQDVLEGVPVARLMRAGVPTAQETTSVGDLVYHQVMRTEERAFPVMRGEQLAGLVCLDDIRKVPREEWDATPVSAIMTPASELAVTTPQEDASAALSNLAGRDVNQLPVVQDGRLVGMLRRGDVLRWLQLHSEGAAT